MTGYKKPMEQHTEGGEPQKKKDYLLPASILIAAVLVSLSLVYSAGKAPSPNVNDGTATQQAGPQNMKPVTKDDHIRGSLDAPVKVVEYSDFECPYCKEFHGTMEQVMQAYGDKVAWIYRHAAFHQKGPQEAEASECVASLGGNDAFWKFNDEIFRITPSNNGLDLSQLPQIAADAGVDKQAFNECMTAGKFTDKVQQETQDAINAGLQGTPYIIVTNKEGKQYVIPGAVPFSTPLSPGGPTVKQIIDEALANK